MSFPNTVYGSYGDDKIVSASKIGGLPLGTRMELPDGRIFRHAKATATILAAGKLYIGEAQGDVDFIDVLATSSAAVGSHEIVVTTGGTLGVTTGQYDDGIIYTASSASSGVPEVYRIKTASTCAAAATTTVTTYEPLKTAIAGGTTLVGMRVNLYQNVILPSADTARVGAPAGVPTTAVPANSYCWLARRGEIPLGTGATVMIVGLPVVSASAQAGLGMQWTAAASGAAASWDAEAEIGWCMSAAGTADNNSLVYLTLE